MTKSEFVDKVASTSGLSKKDAGSAVDAVISSIEDALRSGNEVNFTGFGKFHVAQRGAREGRNPRTGETMTIGSAMRSGPRAPWWC
jgi:DNA-binding protein HU-beta